MKLYSFLKKRYLTIWFHTVNVSGESVFAQPEENNQVERIAARDTINVLPADTGNNLT